jgi:glycosyltransferase involved in cell wall biosynthesis
LLKSVVRTVKQTKGIKLCWVSAYPPNHARLSEYAEGLINELKTDNDVEHIHILADKVGNAKNKTSEKVSIYRIWKPDQISSLTSILATIRKLRPDVVHFNCNYKSFGNSRVFNFLALSLPLICRLLNFKTVVTLHSLYWKINVPKCKFSVSFLDKIGMYIITRFLLFASKVTVTLPSYVKSIQTKFRVSNVNYIPHGTFDSSKMRNLRNHSEGYLLLFGHLSPYKGVEVMMKAMEILNEQGINLTLYIAGGENPKHPGYLNKLQKRSYPPNVKFIGYVGDERIPSLFNNAALVVLPYLTCIGASGVFNLACAYGKPVIASDLPEMRELISQGAEALLVPPGDSEQLARTIIYSLVTPNLLQHMGETNFTYASQHSFYSVADKFCKLYKSLLH